MKLTTQDRINAFRAEWARREVYLIAAGLSEEEMEDHKDEILHRYQLTLAEVEGTWE